MTHPAPIFLRRDDPALPRVLAALGLALGAHLALTGAVALLASLGLLAGHDAPRPAPVDLVAVDAVHWQANRQLGTLPTPAPAPLAPKVIKPAAVEHEQMPRGQVVDVHGGNDQKADDAAFLADRDNKVAHQSRARERTAHYTQAMPMKTTTVASKEDHGGTGAPGEHGNGGVGQDARLQHEGAQAGHYELPSERERSAVAVAETAVNGELHNQTDAAQHRGNSARLLVTPGQLAAMEDLGSLGHAGRAGDEAGGSGEVAEQSGAAPNDRLDGVDEGAGTFLNTRAWKYAQFFNRVKQRVGEQWNVESMMHQRDPRGVYADQERATLLLVSLDAQGRLSDVSVKSSSGVPLLDEEAVAAFQRAQPFPNPPPALFDRDGQLRFSFGFYVEPGTGRSGFRVYRSRD